MTTLSYIKPFLTHTDRSINPGGEGTDLYFTTALRPILRSTTSLSCEVLLETLYQGMKWPELVDVHALSSNDEVRNEKSYNHYPPASFHRVILN
jgi:hypothetical protein